MIFICTSMYVEAHPFIKLLKLKKDTTCCKFQIFKNDEIILIITGIGKIKSAVAVTYLLTKYEPKEDDFLINIGICGSYNKDINKGTICCCNKIIERDTKKTVYPDMILRQPFMEASIETCSSIIKENDTSLGGDLVDMESYGVYQSALVFLKTHQVLFIKIISDYLQIEKINNQEIFKLLQSKAQEIVNWMYKIKCKSTNKKNILSKKEEKTIHIMIKKLKLSTTMGISLKKIFIYYKLQGGDIVNIVKDYMDITCKTKNEGKRYFEEFKQRII